MSTSHRFWVSGLLSTLAVTACTLPGPEEVGEAENAATSVRGVTAQVRKQYIAKAKIWDEAEYAKLPTKDLKAGPRSDDGWAFNQEIVCKFVEPTEPNELGGKTKKFQCGGCPTCTVPEGKVLKVKYSGVGRGLGERDVSRLVDDANDNPEIYAEVIGTRLLWALGFAADGVYPVRVTCLGCPEQPWDVYKDFTPGAGARADRRFNFAVVEEKFPGKKIEVDGWDHPRYGQGWAWRGSDDAVEEVRAAAGPNGVVAPSEQWEAFKLFAAFIGHWDNKADNQRLVCDKGAISSDGRCSSPRLVLHDPGGGFGSIGILGMKKADFDAWDKTSLWLYPTGCQARLPSFDSLRDPEIKEEGRKFLARLMDPAVLTDAKLRDIFEASRVTERSATTRGRRVTVDDWVRAFKTKRFMLTNRTCR